MIFEDYASGWPAYTPDSYVASFAAERFAMLAHETPTIAAMQSAVDLAIARNFGYVYITDDLLDPNPWDSLPSFWADEIAAIAQRNAGLGAEAGVRYDYFEGTYSKLPNFTTLTPVASGVVATFDITPRLRNDRFAFRFQGCIQLPVNGRYTFYLSSDEGSKLTIDGVQVVNNDGLHTVIEKSGTIKLAPGRHPIVATYFEKLGSETLAVQFAGPGLSKQTIPAGMLSQGC